MTNTEIMKALIEGKKIGFSDRRYWYLNIDGYLMASEDRYERDEEIGLLFSIDGAKIIPEEGP